MSGRLVVVDVHDPAAPAVAGELPVNGGVRGLAIRGAIAFLAVTGEGLVAVDVSTPTSPVRISTVATPDLGTFGPWALTLDGTNAYVALPRRGYWIFDVADPASPTELGRIEYPDDTYAMHELAIADGHAFIACSGRGLCIADVHDPAHPLLHGEVATSVPVTSVAADPAAHRVYLGGAHAIQPFTSPGAVDVFDATDPDAPLLLGTRDDLAGSPYRALVFSPGS